MQISLLQGNMPNMECSYNMYRKFQILQQALIIIGLHQKGEYTCLGPSCS